MHATKSQRASKKQTTQIKPTKKITKRALKTRVAPKSTTISATHTPSISTTCLFPKKIKPTSFISHFKFFSTTPPVQIPEVFSDKETAEANEASLPFSVKDAIKIKEGLIDGMKNSDSIRAQLSHLGTAHINAMLKQTQIQNIAGEATLQVIQQLARSGDISLPDIGSGTIAAQNFDTLYRLLQLQDASGKLKQLDDEQWCVLMEMTFGTDPVVTQNVTISDKAAIRIASEYRSRVQSKAFREEIEERMMQYPIAPGTVNPLQIKLAMELRQMEISNIVSPILEEIYSQYQFDGAEGFCLMKKALETHISNGDIVQILNEAQKAIIDASGLDQSAILEN